MLNYMKTQTRCPNIFTRERMKTVFCDESGFDGNNLWHPDQPYFSYAAVCIAPDEADAIIAEAMQRFKPPGNEIKTAKLLRSNPGRKVIQWILEQISGDYQVVCCHKRYCLAAKMFEYMIEPILSSASTYFYSNGLHKLIANGLYYSALADDQYATQTLVEFQQLMRDKDAEKLVTVLDALAKRSSGADEFLNSVLTIIVCNQSEIQSELKMFEGENGEAGVVKWILELTVTALRSLLAELSGKGMEPLVVTCDDSKPLKAGQDFMDAMIGRTDYHELEFGEICGQLTFNLSEKIRFVGSDECCGVQLADVAASSATFAMKNKGSSFAKYWNKSQLGSLHEQSVFPDASVLDLSSFQSVKNTMILQELAARSVRKECLTADLGHLDSLSTMAARDYLGSQGRIPKTL